MAYITSDRIVQTKDSRATQSEFNGISAKCMGSVEGKEVMIKGECDNESYFEYVASQLGQHLGLNINKVDLIDCGYLFGLHSGLCSVHYMENTFKRFGLLYGDEHRKYKNSVQYKEMRFFDLLIYNEDRHDSNFGIINGKELFLIDHGLSYPHHEFDGNDRYDTVTDTISNWNFQKALLDKDLTPMLVKFAKITDYRLNKVLEIPKDVSLPTRFEDRYVTIKKECLQRLRNIRKYLRAELKKQGIDYAAY